MCRHCLITDREAEGINQHRCLAGHIDVLDHGFVQLVDYMGSDLSVARSAKVSYDAAWRAGEDAGSDTRLIRYLARNDHSTPFEAVTFTFEVKAPIFVLRQWHRHRTWSYNELSARYRPLPNEIYVPNQSDITTQATDNKQARTDLGHPEAARIQALIEAQTAAAYETYNLLLTLDPPCPRELARSVLPVATYSHMFATVNLLNLIKFIKLRDHDHAQKEIRVYAQALKKLASLVAPVSVAAWLEQDVSHADPD